MEMSIDEAKQLLFQYQKLFNSLNGDYKLSQVQASELSHSIGTALDIMRRYQMMELDRKSEMVAMLEELKEQLRKLHVDYFETEHFAEAYGLSDSIAIIQLKIDALKGEQA
jgi:hypothetical protein